MSGVGWGVKVNPSFISYIIDPVHNSILRRTISVSTLVSNDIHNDLQLHRIKLWRACQQLILTPPCTKSVSKGQTSRQHTCVHVCLSGHTEVSHQSDHNNFFPTLCWTLKQFSLQDTIAAHWGFHDNKYKANICVCAVAALNPVKCYIYMLYGDFRPSFETPNNSFICSPHMRCHMSQRQILCNSY